jgi:phosphoserine phosphatase RsbU/P
MMLRRLFQQQQLYVFVGVALFAVVSAVGLTTYVWTVLVFTLCVGNLTVPVMHRLEPAYAARKFPLNWLVYVLLLALVALGATVVAAIIVYGVLLDPSFRTREKILTDIRFGTLITVLLGIGVYVYRNQRESLEKENLILQRAVRTGETRLKQQEKELETAREIQAGLIPKQVPQFEALEISASWQPARTVGGDYFDVIPLNDHRVAICIADVVGKGIAAALLMANVQAAVRAFATADAQPAEMCDRLNRVLCSNLAPGKFVTFLCCIVDTRTGTLTCSNAGHCYPLLARAAGSVATLNEGGLVLGVAPDSHYVDAVVKLEPDDKLLLFTDGITEVENGSGEDFGEARLRRAFADLAGARVEAIHSRLMQDVSQFCGGNFTDDATLLVMSYKQV